MDSENDRPIPPNARAKKLEFSSAEIFAYQEIAELERQNFEGRNLPATPVLEIIRRALPPPQARTPDWERFKHDLENTLNDVACGHYSPEEGVELIVSDLKPFLSDVRHK